MSKDLRTDVVSGSPGDQLLRMGELATIEGAEVFILESVLSVDALGFVKTASSCASTVMELLLDELGLSPGV